MKIALMGPYPPPYGGVSTTIKQLLVHLTRDGYEVIIVANQHGSDGLLTAGPRLAQSSSRLARFRHLQEWRPDIIHSHSNRWASLGAVAAASLLRIPLIHTIHGESTPRAFCQLGLGRKLLAKPAMMYPHITVAVSEPLSQFLLSLGIPQGRIRTIPSLLPLECSVSASTVGDVVRRDKIVIVTTGFHTPAYGLGLIPQVAARIQRRLDNFVWFVVGHGTEEAMTTLQGDVNAAGVGKKVALLGEMDRPAILGLLNRCHIYVRTKYHDSFGMVIAEAHQQGCHCLFGDNNPYFHEGHRLTRYHTGDVDSLTTKLLDIMKTIDLEAPRDMCSPFADEAIANYEKIMSLYEHVLSSRASLR